MDAFARFSREKREAYFAETAAKLGIKAQHAEKDFWVCWTLHKLFGLPGIGDQLTFKGGTSLSKAYKLIRRFSEDIDITVSRAYLGFGGEHDPEKAPSGKKRKAMARRAEAGLCEICIANVAGNPSCEDR